MISVSRKYKWHDIQIYDEKGEGLIPALNGCEAELKRPESRHMLLLFPYIGIQFKDDKDAQKSGLEAQGLVQDIFPDCVRGVRGVEVDGSTPTVEDFSSDPAFVPFVWGVFNKLILIGNMTEEEEKNLERPSGFADPVTLDQVLARSAD